MHFNLADQNYKGKIVKYKNLYHLLVFFFQVKGCIFTRSQYWPATKFLKKYI